MRRSPWSLMFAALLCLMASPAAAASFALPSDAVIAVREFTFSATSPAYPDGFAESDFPAAFHAQLALALQKAGFSLYRGESAASLNVPSDAPQNVSPGIPPGVPDQNSPALIVTPLAENSAQDAAAQEETQEEAQREEAAPKTPPAEPETPAQNSTPTHILEGTVTFQEHMGMPYRIAGSSRIRVTAHARCAYTIRDAATGKMLVTDIASGSSASLARGKDDGGILNVVRSRAITAAAETIAATLSGKDSPENGRGSDRSYYQDSPGKRLTPKK